MNEGRSVAGGTPKALLETLRASTARPDLEYVEPPTRLLGGFDAELLRFQLRDPPAELDRPLVARIVANPTVGRREGLIQSAVAGGGFPTPAIRLTADERGPLGRYLIVMDAVDGAPPMANLGVGAVITQIPTVMHSLPDQLAEMAARLHRLNPTPLGRQLDKLGGPFPETTVGFLEEQAAFAARVGRPDLVAVAMRLAEVEPPSNARVITHGDLHPFNLLTGPNGTYLIDWTIARVAHPGFTIGFTTLMLANPPIVVPKPAEVALRALGRRIARRFLATYRRLTEGTAAAVDDENLTWHRKVHALRILVESARWDLDDTRPTSGHPWLVLEPVAKRICNLA